MNEYLHNRLLKLIAPRSIIEAEFSIPYDYTHPNVLSAKEVNDRLENILNFNFGKVTGLKKIINYFTS